MEKEKLIQLVQAAQAGKADAMETLFAEFYNDVYYFAYKTVKNEDVACDITQETFMQIIQSIGDLQEPAAFVTWMKQIAYHKCTRHFSKKTDVLVEEDEDGNTIFDTLADDSEGSIPSEVLEQEEFRKTILDMIDKLTEEQRSAVMMYYFDELTVGQIAQIQGVSEGTVKSRLNYARKAMRKSVEDYEKKTGTKLHSIALLPLFGLAFGKKAMPAAKAAAVRSAVMTSAKAATAGAVTTSATSGVFAKLAALPALVKGIAGGLAALLILGVIFGVILHGGNKPEQKDPSLQTQGTTDTENETVTLKPFELAIVDDMLYVIYEDGEMDPNAELYSYEIPDLGVNLTTSGQRWNLIGYASEGNVPLKIRICACNITHDVHLSREILYYPTSDSQTDEELPDVIAPAGALSPLNVISTLHYHTIAIKEDGTALYKGRDGKHLPVDNWTDLISVSAGVDHVVGLRSDGTVVAAGDNREGECNVSHWTDIVAVEAGMDFTVGLKSDGTMVAAGNDLALGYFYREKDNLNVSAMTCFGGMVTLNHDGTVSFWGDGNNFYTYAPYEEQWTNVVQVSSRGRFLAALLADGTVKTKQYVVEIDASDWTDIVHIATGDAHIVGLKSDGTVVANGNNDHGQCDVSHWTDIVAVYAGLDRTIGLKADGTVVTAGRDRGGEHDLSGWQDIRIP